jgi:peptide-methionine (R)-S-oxide reductase
MLDWDQVLQLAKVGVTPPGPKVLKTPEQWRALLSPDQFMVTRQAGTERPFSSEMCVHFEPGRYHCACCATLLFDAAEKFDSGTGWPSFTQPAHPQAVAYRADHSHGMTRIEALCSTCDAHLGHVFPDGPRPSGLRYCMNALSLNRAP